MNTLKILIADDHPINLRLIERQAALLGFDTTLAHDGVDALLPHLRQLLVAECAVGGAEPHRDREAALPGAERVGARRAKRVGHVGPGHGGCSRGIGGRVVCITASTADSAIMVPRTMLLNGWA